MMKDSGHKSEMRWFDVAGSRLYSYQCKNCGLRTDKAYTEDELHFLNLTTKNHDLQSISKWDYQHSSPDRTTRENDHSYHMRWRDVFRGISNDEWWRLYGEYLKSSTWKAISRAVIERDKTCQCCLSRPAKQAHHLSYKHVGAEPLFELIGVCVKCHDRITEMDRYKQSTICGANGQ